MSVVKHGLCGFCKQERDLPCLQDSYTGNAETPVVRLRVCQECKNDLQECVDKMNAGMSPEQASKELDDKITAREKGLCMTH